MCQYFQPRYCDVLIFIITLHKRRLSLSLHLSARQWEPLTEFTYLDCNANKNNVMQKQNKKKTKLLVFS